MILRVLNRCGWSMYRASCITTNVRTVSYGKRNVEKVQSQKFPGYAVIFEFNKRKMSSFFNRFKYYSTIMAPVYLCLHMYLEYAYDMKSLFTPYLPTLLGIQLTATYAFTMPLNNMVVCVYKGKETEDIKISYISFWGLRKDMCIKLSDIQILPRTNENPLMSYVHIQSTNTNLKIPVKYTTVHDYKEFCTIFGHDVLVKYEL